MAPAADAGTEAGRGGPSGDLSLLGDLLRRLPASVAYVTGPDLVFEFANEEYRRIVGDRDLIGRPLREALPEVPAARFRTLARAIRTGRAEHGRNSEVWLRRSGPEPEQMFVDFVYQPVTDAAGTVTGVLLFGSDVTRHVKDRRRLEVLAERLAVSEERFRTLFETLPIGVVHYNADGSVSGANPAACEILGVAPEAMKAWPLDRAGRAVREDGRPFEPGEPPVSVALRTGEVVRDVVVGLPHGRTREHRWLRVTAVPDARDERGRPKRVYAMITDITDQHRSEAALAESYRLLQRLRDANVVGVAELDEDGVRQANDTYLDLIGYTRAELEAGRIRFTDITPPEWRAANDDAMWQMRSVGVTRPWEKEYLRRDGSRVPVLIWSAVTGREPLRWTSFVVDLTARERRERERADLLRDVNAELEQRVTERTAELVRAERERRALQDELSQAERLQTVGQLASGIAHDFGNLLSIIVGHTELAEDVGGDLDPEIRRILGEIRHAADRAVHLSGDLLRFSRRTRVAPVPVDLNELITGLLDLVAASLSGRGRVLLHLSPAPLPPVLADRGQLEQVLMNLAVNARDAMPGGGTLAIGTGVADPPEQVRRRLGGPAGGYVELSVADTGTGMNEQVRARMFDRFFTTKPAGQGTGLGLSTVHGIVADLGGAIEVESREGHGTTFRIFLPAGSRAAVPAPRDPHRVRHRGSRRSRGGLDVAAGDHQRRDQQDRGRPADQHQHGPGRGEQSGLRVHADRLVRGERQGEPAEPGVPRRGQDQAQHGQQVNQADCGGDRPGRVPDDRTEPHPDDGADTQSEPRGENGTGHSGIG
jgi:PAS domain S-box-containing protein